jgi:hypothetical protein
MALTLGLSCNTGSTLDYHDMPLLVSTKPRAGGTPCLDRVGTLLLTEGGEYKIVILAIRSMFVVWLATAFGS